MGMAAVALGEGDADFGAANTVLGQGDLHVVMENQTSPDEAAGGEQRWPKGHPGADGKKWYTIQRVNGSADTGGRGRGGDDTEDEEMNDGEGGRNLDHKHTLEESDRIKKNSVQRWLLKEEKEKRSGKKVRLSLNSLLPLILIPFHTLSFALFFPCHLIPRFPPLHHVLYCRLTFPLLSPKSTPSSQPSPLPTPTPPLCHPPTSPPAPPSAPSGFINPLSPPT